MNKIDKKKLIITYLIIIIGLTISLSIVFMAKNKKFIDNTIEKDNIEKIYNNVKFGNSENIYPNDMFYEKNVSLFKGNFGKLEKTDNKLSYPQNIWGGQVKLTKNEGVNLLQYNDVSNKGCSFLIGEYKNDKRFTIVVNGKYTYQKYDCKTRNQIAFMFK